MFRSLLKSKIHCATAIDCELHDEGSCFIDEERAHIPVQRASAEAAAA